jgi:ABC-2 type transport system ATP-binding protein
METALSIKGLSKNYGSVVALAPLDLEIAKGEIFGYLGPNGAGKTTTIRAILGLIKPTAGSSEIFGINSQNNKVEAHKHIAYVPGESSFWPSLTGSETLHLLGKVHGRIDTEYQKELITRFKFDPDKKVRAYSKGNRQKINLIAALSTRADILIMDEPTTGLDPIMEQAFRQSILEAKENGQTVFLSSHILEEVEALCDRIGILQDGKLVELGTLSQMRHLSSVSVQATFEDTPPDVCKVAGVTNVVVTGNQLNCQVTGHIEPLFKILIEAHPKTLLSREPSLEELFLALYGGKEVSNKKSER